MTALAVVYVREPRARNYQIVGAGTPEEAHELFTLALRRVHRTSGDVRVEPLAEAFTAPAVIPAKGIDAFRQSQVDLAAERIDVRETALLIGTGFMAGTDYYVSHDFGTDELTALAVAKRIREMGLSAGTISKYELFAGKPATFSVSVSRSRG